jgi:hypothetical protein
VGLPRRDLAMDIPHADVELWEIDDHWIGLDMIVQKGWSLHRHVEVLRSTTQVHWWPQRITKRRWPRMT